MTYPTFSNGQVLPASDLNAIGLWLVKSQTVGSGVSSVTVTGAFSADYDNYLLTYTGGVGSSGAAGLRIAFNVDTAVNYYSNTIHQTAGVATVNGTAFGATTGLTTVGYVDTGDFSLTLVINDPNKVLNTSFSGQFTCLGGASRVGTSGGWAIGTGQNTGFTLSPSAGTITGGTIRVYGYRN